MSLDVSVVKTVKDSHRYIWGVGHYAPLARLLEEAAEDLVDSCAVLSDQDVLDAGAGNGNVALAAAGRGARVVAGDLSPAMVDLGRTRTAAAGLAVDWREVDIEELPLPEVSFDRVLCAFAAALAPRPERTAAELTRVLRPGGVLGLTNWTPDSFLARLGGVLAAYDDGATECFDLPDPYSWGEEEKVSDFFGDSGCELSFARRTSRWRFSSAEVLVEMLANQGGLMLMRQAMPDEVFDRVRRDIVGLIERENRGGDRDGTPPGGPGQIVIDNDYLRVLVRKPPA